MSSSYSLTRAATARDETPAIRHSGRTFGSFAVLPSNVSGVETAMHFASGLSKLAVIVGPSGWGKSHVLDGVYEKMAERHEELPRVVCASDWLAHPASGDPAKPLLLDDVQELVGKPRARIQFRLALERRVKSGRPTLLSYTAPRKTRHLNAILPSIKDWNVGVISEPAPSERMLVISELASGEGLTLSTALTKVIAHKMRGNGRTLVGALRRLRLHGPLWADVNGTLKAFGVLEPFFADSGTWDLRGHILACAKGFSAAQYGITREDLATYTMLRLAVLCEMDVARTMKVEPGEAYNRAVAFEKQLAQSESALLAVRNFAEIVVDGLLAD